MHEGWPYVAATYTLILVTLGLWFAMIARRFMRVRAALALLEAEAAPGFVLETLIDGSTRASDLLSAVKGAAPPHA